MFRYLKIAYEYFALYSSLTLLGLICLSWTVFALPLYFLLPRELGTKVGRRGIMEGFRIYAWSLSATRAYRLDLSAIDALRGAPSMILAPNHPSLIDALLILTRHPNIVCVMKAELMRNIFLGSGSRLARYVPNESSRQMVKESVAHLNRGCLLLLFPEGTRSRRSPINPLVGSVGLIAKHAGVPVQTLIIETDSPFLSKGLAAVQEAGAAHRLSGQAGREICAARRRRRVHRRARRLLSPRARGGAAIPLAEKHVTHGRTFRNAFGSHSEL